jgi:hypothetical protein
MLHDIFLIVALHGSYFPQWASVPLIQFKKVSKINLLNTIPSMTISRILNSDVKLTVF